MIPEAGLVEPDQRARLAHLPRTATRARRTPILTEILTDFAFATAKVRYIGVRELIEDYDRALAANLKMSPEAAAAIFEIRSALHRAAPVVLVDWTQLAAQLLGHLDATRSRLLAGFTERARAWREGPWLEPARPTLRYSGQSAQLIGRTATAVADMCAVGTTRCAALSPDGIARVWDLRSGDLEQTLVCGVPATSIAADAEGRVLAVGADDGTVITWDVDSGLRAGRFRAHAWEVTAVAFLPHRVGLVTGSADGTIVLCPFLDQDHGGVLFRHAGWISRVAMIPEGALILACCSDGSAWAWSADGPPLGVPISLLPSASTWANDVAVSPDGTRAAVAYEDGTVRPWFLPEGSRDAVLADSPSGTRAVTFLVDGERIACGDGTGKLRVYNTRRQQLTHTLAGHTEAVTALVSMADGSLLSGADDGQVLRWEMNGTGRAEEELGAHADCVNGLAIHPDGRRAVSASHDGTIKVWSVPGGRVLGTFATHGWKCMSVAFTPAGDLVISAGTDGLIRLWAWPSGRAVATIAGHANSVNWVSVTPDGRFAISASEDTTIRMWNLRTSEEVRRYCGHQLGVRSVAVTPQGNRLVSTSIDGTLKIWDIAGPLLHSHGAHNDWVNGVAVTPDGQYALSSSDRLTASLMMTRIDTGEPALAWQGHAGPAFGVAITSDGRRAVSSSLDGRLRIWDLECTVPRTPALVCEFTAGQQLYSCAVSQDGQTIMAGAQSGQVHVLALHEDRAFHGD